jgi:alkanesulfonate monooxygenase SsuD/methylene tetrahydromethanopterin reductase-like flavin-dependent oxidoreductase (luciferase family)
MPVSVVGMEIGIGLPNTIPGTPGPLMVEWARRAEERGFAGLATIDRIAYPNYDSLTTLAAAAGATSRIGLLTNILVAPAYQPVILAKAAASIDQLSGGRFTLGVAAGGRPDDFAAIGRDFQTRGREFDASLDLMHRIWSGEEVAGSDVAASPTPVHDGRVPMLFGGTGEYTLRRVRRYGDGWASGGAPAEYAAPFAERVRTTWRDAGRAGEPRLAALNYFSLGDDDSSRRYLHHYYRWLGDFAEQIAEGALRTPRAIRDSVKAFEDNGFTELYLDPTVASLGQLDRLADVVF